ncbi:HoxN/HupN/NixA family nickel/cobalt transporter [Sulfolobus sp. E5-1-F]|uniref:HoxN/HupN/NixA family nickel/cobalt transporter n=1 Tax=Saccharolobus sp. E5-1-F TaxID=2663019 RepID=UPI0012955E38|nr:HoxN/HupN/NixA family nickel/cobalt transporter [Sulfolobus sp. E5-1-F]QGA54306.1 HoxN/HupN/NixA family nickel/cobalt transporter [Sulfolobus sp. E5-1-F]
MLDRLSIYVMKPNSNTVMQTIGHKNLVVLSLFYITNVTLTALFFLFLYTLPQKELTIKTDTGEIIGTFITIGILSYTFGLRHAVDADHLAAIDNVTRKMLQEEKNTVFVGTFFSFGHSTVVILLSLALMFATRFISSSIPSLENLGSLISTLISGGFLYLLGLLNTIVLYELYSLYKERKHDKQKIEQILQKRGFMNRYFNKLFKIVSKQWQMYIIGLLFGLGFDTATEVAILSISAILASTYIHIPIYTILIFPIIFSLGMSLIDTTDGVFMTFTYGWAFLSPLRKLWYNLTMTLISILIAFGIGTIELLGLLQAEFNLTGLFWDQIAALNNVYWETIGYYVILTFIVTWIASAILYKIKKIE